MKFETIDAAELAAALEDASVDTFGPEETFF